MKFFRPATPRQLNIGLAALRALVGTIFLAHGWQKLFVFGFAAVTGAFAQMHVPMPSIMGPFIGFLEFFGGLALIFGLLTRLTGLILAVEMVGAIALVHMKNGFFLPSGAEFALAMLAPSLALVSTGAGAYSLDGLVNALDKADRADAIAGDELSSRRAA